MTEITEIARNERQPAQSGVAVAYYDGSCPICAAEVATLREIADSNTLMFLDCAARDFDEGLCLAEGVSKRDMMEALHLRDAAGHWYRGVDAITGIYHKVGLTELADLWSFSPMRALMRWVYPWFARNRQRLSRFGLPAIMERVIRFHARRAHRRATQCSNNNCSIH